MRERIPAKLHEAIAHHILTPLGEGVQRVFVDFDRSGFFQIASGVFDQLTELSAERTTAWRCTCGSRRNAAQFAEREENTR